MHNPRTAFVPILGAILFLQAGCSGGGSSGNLGTIASSSSSSRGLERGHQRNRAALDSPENDGQARESSSSCSGYPRPGCTGLAAGTPLEEYPLNVDGDSYAVRTPDTQLVQVHIPGNLLIRADNITIISSQIDGTVYNDESIDGVVVHHPYTIRDSTIGPEMGCITQPALLESDYTAVNVLVRNHDDGFRVSPPGNVTIRDSYVKMCWQPPEVAPPDGSHSDGLQFDCRGGICDHVIFDHNTVDGRHEMINTGITIRHVAGDPDREDNPIGQDITVNDNLIMGGGYSMVTWAPGPTPWIITNNRVVDGSWAFGPHDGNQTCSFQSWSGNELVTIDENYDITSVVGELDCVE